MSDRIIVDPEVLLEVSLKIGRVKKEIEDVVDTLSYIKRMTWETWGKDNVEAEVFADNCQSLRNKTISLMVHVEQRGKGLQEASGLYDAVNDHLQVVVKQLEIGDIF